MLKKLLCGSALLLFIVIFSGGCATLGNRTSQVSGTRPLVFTVSPFPVEKLVYLVPLGNLNPPDHTFPTDHVYFYYSLTTPTKDHSVYCPATAEVNSIIQPDGNDHKITFKYNDRYSFYLDHVYLKSGISAGNLIQAGDLLGTTSDKSYAVDLGVVDSETTLTGFAKPGRYIYQTLHTVSPFPFFTEPLKSSLMAKNRREGSDKDGKIDFDQPGKLVGNWFLEGLAEDPNSSNGRSAWTKHLAFVYDNIKPTQVHFAIGGELTKIGLFEIPPTDPDPANISESSGKIVYSLYGRYTTQFPRDGALLVQMIAADRIKVETFAGDASPTDFTGAAKVYTR